MQCEVPGCTGTRVKEDSCTFHATPKNSPGALPNDGIIDWIAIELATEGGRLPRLTWVERDIAAAVLFARGWQPRDVINRLGINLKSGKRRQRVYAMAESIKQDGGRIHAGF